MADEEKHLKTRPKGAVTGKSSMCRSSGPARWVRRGHHGFLLSSFLACLSLAHRLDLVAGVESVNDVLTSPPSKGTPKCDRMFISNPDGPKTGNFSAPWLSNPQGHLRQCIFTFIAAEGERVQVQFINFSLRGSPPECSHEYLDLYTELSEPSSELIASPFGGRYCGRIMPRRRISMYRTLIIGFYTDAKLVQGDLFQGVYEFVDAGPYKVGTPAPNSVCSFTIYGDSKGEGDFMSPTYPGIYPKNLQCQYRFMGKTNQRVRLEFLDFDLFYGGTHCPFDVVKIYDGATSEAPLIGTFCGQQRNLVIYSEAENLFVKFNTLQRTADSQNRGFSGRYEFKEKFASLSFIKQNNGEHIRGTECDQKILSRKENNGTVYSPNYPFLFQPEVICRYYIYGMQDAQHLERVKVQFDMFDIPSKDEECTDSNLKLYLQGLEESRADDDFDQIFCGKNTPQPVSSEGPRLMMVFSSGAFPGQGFKATYFFETDYKVPGTPSPDGTCHFTYQSDSHKHGDFNSPRHPSNYPSNTRCQYIFAGKPGEQVKLVFNFFRTKTADEIKGYNEQCNEDWLEVYELFPSGKEIKLGRYCSKTAPGPIVSGEGSHSMKVLLFTNEEGVSSGFLASYTFLPVTSKFGDCGENISGGESGVVTTPNFPNNYQAHRQFCNWYITVRPQHRVLLYFDFFLIEGDPVGRGCPGAVVRVWRDQDQPPVEICGEGLTNETKQIVSTTRVMKLSFITAEKAVGSVGFKATWTEIKDGKEWIHGNSMDHPQKFQVPGSNFSVFTETNCEGFRCKTSGFCISERCLCNELPNCGLLDDSDEYNCVRPTELNLYLIAAASGGGVILLMIIICVVCHRKRRRRRRRHAPPPFEPRQKAPREIPGMHFISVDSV